MSSQIDRSANSDMSVATLMTLAASGVQPGWLVLDTARAHQFTGEIVFRTQPEMTVYFDGGHAYHATRAGDPTLCERLIAAGVVEPAQIERGAIRVGNIENLGRLFDRDPSIDRDSVMVLLELATDDMMTELANSTTSGFTLTAYRHHASGIHRWFVAPNSANERPPAQLTPVGRVAEIDSSVTSDLPALSGGSDDRVHIEFAQPTHDALQPQPPQHEPAPAPLHSLDIAILQSLLDEVDAQDAAPGGTPSGRPAGDGEPAAATVIAPLPSEPVIAPIVAPLPAPAAELPVAPVRAPFVDAGSADDFQIVWPDGSEQSLIGVAADSPLFTTAPVAPDLAPTVAPSPGVVSPFPAPSFATAVTDAASSEILPTPTADNDLVDANDVRVDVVGRLEDRDDVDVVDDVVVDVDVDVAAVTPGTTIVPLDEIEPPMVAPVAAPVADVQPNLTFEMPRLAVTADHLPADHQPEEVVDAVRRALEAIEAASAVPARLPAVAVGDLPSFEPTRPLHFDVVDPLAAGPHRVSDVPSDPYPVERPLVDAALTVDAPAFTDGPDNAALDAALPASDTASVATGVAPQARGGFAAPTMNDSAEAVYARAAGQSAAIAGPASDVTSVVFVDEAPTEREDRTGALSRLISSLRRK